MSSQPQYELLINAEFVSRLIAGIDDATDRIFIQVMTFDGDDAGLNIASRLISAAARGVEVRLIVDMFAFRYVSDTKVPHPSVAGEVAATHDMFDRMEAAGVQITYVNPWGPMQLFAPMRNHKKIYVLDEHAYIGGINISDHNFEWLDFNIGFTDTAMVQTVVDDFLLTTTGGRQALQGALVSNHHVEATFNEMVESAQSSIVVASPYALDIDLARRLEVARAPSKTVIAPVASNSKMFRTTDPYIRTRLQRAGVALRTYSSFFHAKFALVDDETLLVGSTNFGRHSFRCNQEICLRIDDDAFVQMFIDRVVSTSPVDLKASRLRYAAGSAAAWYMQAGLTLVERLVAPRAPTLTQR